MLMPVFYERLFNFFGRDCSGFAGVLFSMVLCTKIGPQTALKSVFLDDGSIYTCGGYVENLGVSGPRRR